MYKRALKIDEKILSPEHPDVALSLNNLALLYCDQERYDEAEALYKRVLTILEKALGPDHQNVAYVLENLASLYLKTGKKDEAKKLSEQAKQIRLKKVK
jgi:tetratricopeptide (TPR) repeat protein